MASMDRGMQGPLLPVIDQYIPSPGDGFDFDAVKDVSIYDQQGCQTKFHTLFQDRKAIIIFVRHFLCYVCKEYVEDIAKIPKEFLQEANVHLVVIGCAPHIFSEEANVRLVVIGCAPHIFIEEFRQETRFPHELYCDPDRNLYKALGLNTEEAFSKASRHVKSSILSGVLQSTWRAVKSGQYHGDLAQQGGQFIVGPGNILHYSWRDRSSQDHTPINQLLADAGVQQVILPNDPRIIQI